MIFRAYGSAVQDELFQFLTEQAVSDGTLTEYTVKQIMDTWTTQAGFPLIRVSKASGDRIYISQVSVHFISIIFLLYLITVKNNFNENLATFRNDFQMIPISLSNRSRGMSQLLILQNLTQMSQRAHFNQRCGLDQIRS
jgi:hypothetical protein